MRHRLLALACSSPACRSPRRRLPCPSRSRTRQPPIWRAARRRTRCTARAATGSTAAAAWGLRWRVPGCGARPTRRQSSTSSWTAFPAPSMMGAWSLSEREISAGGRLRPLAGATARRSASRRSGSRARDLRTRAAVPRCHIVDGDGSGLGPDLTDVGTRRGSAFLRESLLDPGAARPERPVPYEPYGYPAYVVVRAQPRGGAEVVGVRVNEDSFTVQLRDQQGRAALVSQGRPAMPAARARDEPHAQLPRRA